MKIRFIYNPCSGKNRRNPGLLVELERRIAENPQELTLSITQGSGHATTLAQEALMKGCGMVVAVGGDGTMNETAQALIGKDATLALVPCGSGNGLAIHLGIPTQPHAALDLIFSQTARSLAIDTGTANDLVFCNAMGIGLDAEISQRFNRLKRRGFSSYVRTSVTALAQHRPVFLHVSDAREKSLMKLHAMLLTVANSDQYGNRAVIAPGASVEDGRFDLVAIRPLSLPDLVMTALRLFRGTIDRSSRVHRLSGSHFIVTRPFSGPIHADGETHHTGPRIEIKVVPKSLRILVPKSSPPLRPKPTYSHG